jgi:hypothetical protein
MGALFFIIKNNTNITTDKLQNHITKNKRWSMFIMSFIK